MRSYFSKILTWTLLTATVKTPRIELSILTLSFTLEFLRPYVPTASFYILMYISGGVIGMGRSSFRGCHKMTVHGSKVISVWVSLS